MLHYQGVFSNGFFSFMLNDYYLEFLGIIFYILIALILLITILAGVGLFTVIKKVINNVM